MTTEGKTPDLNIQIKELEQKNAQLIKQLVDLKERGGCDAKIGDTVEVVGLSSWKDWTGTLVSIDAEKGRAGIEIVRKKSGNKELCYTNLAGVRKYVTPAPAPAAS